MTALKFAGLGIANTLIIRKVYKRSDKVLIAHHFGDKFIHVYNLRSCFQLEEKSGHSCHYSVFSLVKLKTIKFSLFIDKIFAFISSQRNHD